MTKLIKKVIEDTETGIKAHISNKEMSFEGRGGYQFIFKDSKISTVEKVIGGMVRLLECARREQLSEEYASESDPREN